MAGAGQIVKYPHSKISTQILAKFVFLPLLWLKYFQNEVGNLYFLRSI